MMDFAALITEQRKLRNMSLADLARMTDISRAHLHMVERGQSEVSFNKGMRILEALGQKPVPDTLTHDECVLLKAWQNHDYPAILRMVAMRIEEGE